MGLTNSKDLAKLQIEQQQKEIAVLKSKIETLQNTSPTTSAKNSISLVQIDKLIDQIMKERNIEYLPDFVERQVYRNILTIIFNLLEGTIDNSSIQLVGHEIKLTINPIKETI